MVIDLSILKNLSILIVEDSKTQRVFLGEYLKQFTKKIYVASNGKEGLDIYSIYRPNIVVTDAIMPIMDGIELAKAIKSKNNSTPVLLITSLDSSIISKAIESGVDEYIPKPIDVNILSKMLYKTAISVNNLKSLQDAETLLRQYKEAVDKSTIVSKTNPMGFITYANDEFCKISGYTRAELIGQPHRIVRHQSTPKELFKELWNRLKDKQIWKGILKNRAKDGSTYVVDATIIPILDIEDKIVEYVAIRHDITELDSYKELLKKELNSSQEDLREKVTHIREYEKVINSSCAFSRTDIDGIITFANDTFCSYSGYSKDELIGKSHNIIRHIDTPDSLFEDLWKTIKSKKIWSGVIKNRKKDGDEFYVSVTITPILDINGEIIEFMNISSEISETINLHQEIEDTQKEIIYKMGEITESRSKETGNHVKRVAEYSKILALKYGLSINEAELIKMSSPMHDLGKVAIADAILNKPAKFTNDEFEIMKTHAKIGYEMLKSSNREILKSAAIIAKEHHEKYDGSGYPDGLKGDEIHIYARIVAVADVFDALSSDRCYKKAWELERVLEFFNEQKGLHFEPKLVELFLENLKLFLDIRERFRD